MIDRILVVGAGQMGGGIAQVAATAGAQVTLVVLLAGLAIAALVYVLSGGHVFFLPLILLLPVGLLIGRRRRR